jgi:alpha-L-rhamnosidase
MVLHVTSLTFEHHRPGQALGIGVAKPRLSWKVAGNVKGWNQVGVEIELTRSPALQREHFSLELSESVLVPWPSASLLSGESATVRVKIRGYDSDGAESQTEWSVPSFVETGLLERVDWNDSWLIKSQVKVDVEKPKEPVRFRRAFQIQSSLSIRKARLYATAHGVYEAQINGKKVGDHVLSPGWQSYAHRLAYQTFDITALLGDGENVIGVDVAEGWFSGRLGFLGGHRNLFGDYIGLVAKLRIFLHDGSVFDVGTDQHWKSSSAGELIASEIYDGEICDLRKYVNNWACCGYDDDLGWKQVKVEPLPDIELFAPSGPPVRATETIAVQRAWKSPSGKQLVDFGQNLVGRLRIRIPRGSPEGTSIILSHAEVLENDELGTRPLRYAKCQDTLILGNDDCLEFWEPKFTFHGFRYAQIDGWPSSDFDISAVEAVVLHTDMQRIGDFQCSDPLVTKLHQNIVWSMRGNFLSVPTDCPQRDERLGWTGDLAVFAPTANYLYNTTGMLSDWLRDLSADQLAHPDAVPPLVVPDMLAPYGDRGGSALWGDVTTLVPWSLFLFSGDEQILREQYPSIQGWLDKAVERDESGLWTTVPKNFEQLGDWLDPKAPPDDPGNSVTDPLLTADAFLIHSTELARDTALRLGLTDDAERYGTQAGALRESFLRKYIAPSGRIVSDSQTAYALAINFSLFSSETQKSAAGARLRELVLRNARFKIATGFAGTPFLPHALSKVGATQLFYRMLMHKKCPSWLYQVQMGATTMWERWDSMLEDGSINPGDMTSFNHYALGSVGNWIHKYIGGIRIVNPGGKRVMIAPEPGGDLKWAKAMHETPYGMVQCEWKLEGEQVVIDIVVPPNSAAEVLLPGNSDTILVGSGKHSFRATSYKPKPWPPKPVYPKHYPHVDDEP